MHRRARGQQDRAHEAHEVAGGLEHPRVERLGEDDGGADAGEREELLVEAAFDVEHAASGSVAGRPAVAGARRRSGGWWVLSSDPPSRVPGGGTRRGAAF